MKLIQKTDKETYFLLLLELTANQSRVQGINFAVDL